MGDLQRISFDNSFEEYKRELNYARNGNAFCDMLKRYEKTRNEKLNFILSDIDFFNRMTKTIARQIKSRLLLNISEQFPQPRTIAKNAKKAMPYQMQCFLLTTQQSMAFSQRQVKSDCPFMVFDFDDKQAEIEALREKYADIAFWKSMVRAKNDQFTEWLNIKFDGHAEWLKDSFKKMHYAIWQKGKIVSEGSECDMPEAIKQAVSLIFPYGIDFLPADEKLFNLSASNSQMETVLIEAMTNANPGTDKTAKCKKFIEDNTVNLDLFSWQSGNKVITTIESITEAIKGFFKGFQIGTVVNTADFWELMMNPPFGMMNNCITIYVLGHAMRKAGVVNQLAKTYTANIDIAHKTNVEFFANSIIDPFLVAVLKGMGNIRYNRNTRFFIQTPEYWDTAQKYIDSITGEQKESISYSIAHLCDYMEHVVKSHPFAIAKKTDDQHAIDLLKAINTTTANRLLLQNNPDERPQNKFDLAETGLRQIAEIITSYPKTADMVRDMLHNAKEAIDPVATGKQSPPAFPWLYDWNMAEIIYNPDRGWDSMIPEYMKRLSNS